MTDLILPDWVNTLIEMREPNLVIGGADNPYLRRWHLVPRNPRQNVYLHHFLRSDDDRALHSHPWTWNLSILLAGRYLEHLRDGSTALRQAADPPIVRTGEAWHRIELVDGPCWTLFMTGETVREWGLRLSAGLRPLARLHRRRDRRDRRKGLRSVTANFNERRALLFHPFQGDETDVTRLSDRIVTAAKDHPRCLICEGSIAKGERHRALTELNNEDRKVMTFRFCTLCCAAMADPDTFDTGRAIDARYTLGKMRRKELRTVSATWREAIGTPAPPPSR